MKPTESGTEECPYPQMTFWKTKFLITSGRLRSFAIPNMWNLLF